jgi:hypothetical protein
VKCPFVRLIKHHVMKTYGGSGGTALPFLTSALDGGEWSVSRFTHGSTTAPDTHWTRGGPQSRSGRYGDEKNLTPAKNGTPIAQPVARHYSYTD